MAFLFAFFLTLWSNLHFSYKKSVYFFFLMFTIQSDVMGMLSYKCIFVFFTSYFRFLFVNLR